ncbi:hypothetical protein [Streptomyces sp. NPDC001492]
MTTRNVYVDCEFLPADPSLKGLVSIALTDDQGIDYYAVNRGMDLAALHAVPWMVDNVWPHLPIRREQSGEGWLSDLDYGHRDVHSTAAMRSGIAAYFANTDAEVTHLWAWYGAQDMCRLHSLWDNDWSVMPDQIPRWFNELETLRWQSGSPEMPEQDSGAHNALADARHNRTMHRFLLEQLTGQGFA